MATPSIDAQASKELDPRVVRSKAAILDAAAKLLTEHGAAGVTIDGVGERSGVARTTIYRHWPSRAHLVFDAFQSLFQVHEVSLPTGPLRERLEGMLLNLVNGLTSSPWAPAVTTLIDAADRDPEMRQLLHDFLASRMEAVRPLLRAAMDAGELRADLRIEATIAMLSGAVFYRRLVSREPADAQFVAEIVDQFLRSAEPNR